MPDTIPLFAAGEQQGAATVGERDAVPVLIETGDEFTATEKSDLVEFLKTL